MRNLEISGIPCLAEIDLNRIPTVGNLTEINRVSETRKFSGNVMEILTEVLNGNKYKISGITRNNPEILKTNGNSGQNPRKFQSMYVNYVNPYKRCPFI